MTIAYIENKEIEYIYQMVVYIIFVIIIIIILILYKLLRYVNDHMLFLPIQEEICRLPNYEYFEEKYNVKIRSDIVQSTNDCEIYYTYINNNKDTLFLFAHGNSGNILNRISSPNIQFLLKYGSVIMFDYRGYGCSTGNPSEQGIKQDTLTIWNHIIDKLGYTPHDVILYGESLGCSCVSWLVYNLMNENKDIPRGIIMQSGFYSLKRIVMDMLHPLFGYLVLNEFDNSKYVKVIKRKNRDYPILLFHSKCDEVINYSHSQKLSLENNCLLQEISGTHNSPIFDDKNDKIMREYFNL